jgi:hypothetical protein
LGLRVAGSGRDGLDDLSFDVEVRQAATQPVWEPPVGGSERVHDGRHQDGAHDDRALVDDAI